MVSGSSETDVRLGTLYRQIEGEWHGERLSLVVDHVQGDPFAAPSRVRPARP